MGCGLERLELRTGERKLISRCREGRLADLACNEPVNVREGADWDSDRREVRSEVIATLAVGCCDDHPVHYRGLRLRGAHVTGMLDLRYATLDRPLWLDHCYFDEVVSLRCATAAMVSLDDSYVPRLDAPYLTTTSRKGGLRMQRAIVESFVDLVGAHIGGPLILSGASLGGGLVPGLGSVALNADRMTTDQSMFARTLEGHPFSAIGQVRLPGARIGGQLDMTGANLVGGEDFRYGIAIALNATHLRVDEVFRLSHAQLAGQVDLTAASVASLLDRDVVWPNTVLDRFCYAGLPETRDANPTREAIQRRIKWVEGDAEGYTPSPWEQLRRVYRQAGMTNEAQDIGIAQQRVRHSFRARNLRGRPGRSRWMAPAVQAWSRLLDTTVGYGYRTWRVTTWLAIIYIIGLVIFGLVWEAGGFQPTGADARVFALPWYTLDVLVPLVDLGQQSAWLPTLAASAESWAMWFVMGWYWSMILAGWLLATLAIAGMTGVLRRD